MGQYFMLTNYTRHESVRVGKFYGDWTHYLKVLKWSEEDEVVARGDQGDVFYLHDDLPELVEDMDRDGVWEMCKFAAKKLGVTPEEFYSDFLLENSEEVGEEVKWSHIDFASFCELEAYAVESQ